MKGFEPKYFNSKVFFFLIPCLANFFSEDRSKFPGLLCIILALGVGYLVQRIPLFSLSSVQRELALPGSYCHVLVSTAARGQALASLLRGAYFVFSLYGSKVPLVF